MNKYLLKFLIFLYLALLHSTKAIDSNLENVIKGYNQDNLTLISSLDAVDRSITDLIGIEQLTGLINVDLEENSFSDISPLTSLTGLQHLDISWGGKVTSLNGIQNLTNLRTLHTGGQKISSISELVNLSNLTYIDLKENYINLADPNIQSQIQSLRDRGVFVDIEYQIPISIQNLSAQKSARSIQLETNANDPKTNFIHGFELFLDLLEDDSEGSLKFTAINGGATNELNNFTLADLWRNDLGYDENSNLNSFADLDQLEDYIIDTLLPKLTEINSHLKKLADSTTTISLTQDLTGNENVIIADNGDAFALMAIIEAKKGFFQFLTSYQWDSNLENLDGKEKQGLINMETILDSSKNFLKLKPSNLLNQSKESFKNAISYYKQASSVMRSRIETERLFKMESSDISEDDQFIADINQFLLALDNNHNLSEDSTEVDTISLDALFSGKVDFANQIPAAVGDKFETDVVEDPTFGGLMPNWTPEILKAKMKKENLVSSDSMDGAVDVKGATNWKQSGWLGYFYIPNRTDPNNFWMYHMYLKWVYFYSSSPADIWFFRQTGKNSDGTLKGDWFWTKKSIFPNLFRQTDNAWFYLMPNGQGFKQWNNTSWIDADI
jgi:hypothetical protein